MSLSQRLVSILSAAFCSSLSLEAPGRRWGAWRGPAPRWQKRRSKRPARDGAFPLPQTNSLDPLSLSCCVPAALEGCWGEQACGEGVMLGEQRTRLGACSGAQNEEEKLLLSAWSRGDRRQAAGFWHPSPALLPSAMELLGSPRPSFEGSGDRA